MKKYSKFIILFSIFCFLLSLSINICWAENKPLLESSEEVIYEGSLENSSYTLNDFVRVLVRASQIILGIVGSLALLMFIYGGVIFLISAGNSEKVAQAKQIIVSAVIGLIIVFTSYMIINFAAKAMGIEGNILQTGWF